MAKYFSVGLPSPHVLSMRSAAFPVSEFRCPPNMPAPISLYWSRPQGLARTILYSWELLMRIAIGQLWQETNTFNRNPTRVADFEHWGVATGSAVLERFGKTGELGGFVDGCRQWPADD